MCIQKAIAKKNVNEQLTIEDIKTGEIMQRLSKCPKPQ
jgi:hypothetical protein